MAQFITNINLKDKDENDYDSLQKELAKEYFKCEISPARTKSQLNGKGTFFREGSITIQEVTDAVLRATSRTGKKYSFFVLKDKIMVNSNQ